MNGSAGSSEGLDLRERNLTAQLVRFQPREGGGLVKEEQRPIWRRWGRKSGTSARAAEEEANHAVLSPLSCILQLT